MHPRRGPDSTFKFTTRETNRRQGTEEQVSRSAVLFEFESAIVVNLHDIFNAVTACQVTLLNHTDHAHYPNPGAVMGIAGIEGASVSTFTDMHHAWNLLEEVHKKALAEAPAAFGRTVDFYEPKLASPTSTRL